MHFKTYCFNILLDIWNCKIELELTCSAWNIASNFDRNCMLFYLNNFYSQLKCLQVYFLSIEFSILFVCVCVYV